MIEIEDNIAVYCYIIIKYRCQNQHLQGLISIEAVIDCLKSKKIENLAMDVHEQEIALFFDDKMILSNKGIH